MAIEDTRTERGDFLNFPCYLNLAQECDPSVRNKWDTQRVMEIISLFVHYNWQ